ncbi:MAG: alkaline phytoceramidase [Gemmatimonas sp.]
MTAARLPTLIVGVAAVALLAYGPIAQFADYHAFADTRTWLGIPNAADVLSNAAFAGIGAWAVARLWPHRGHPALARGWAGWMLFAASLVLTAAGSSWYHLAPDDSRLVWDRLPIALGCAGILAAVRAETCGRSGSLWPTLVLSVAAVASVAWWRQSGDLRPYLLLQASPLVLVPLWQTIHGAPSADRTAFAVAILLYAAAKAAELADRWIYGLSGVVSGHTLKHLLAAAAAGVIVARLIARVRR